MTQDGEDRCAPALVK